MEKSPSQLYEEREKRIQDVIALKTPDRVPVMCHFGFFPARYKGITFEQAMYDYDKMMSAWVDTMLDFQPDMVENPFTIRYLGPIMETLDYRQLKWAGHGCHEMASYQYIEDEYMKAEEYDVFLFDPTDFILRKYWPRIFGTLEPMKDLPPLNGIITYYMGLLGFAAFGSPEMESALETLLQASKKARKMLEGAAAFGDRMKELGFPPQAGSLAQAPFDTLSDFFRGTRGAMLDMFRYPEKIQAAVEKLLPIMIQSGLAAKRRGVNRVFIPLHKGLDGFMSLDQFQTFYWPTLKKLMVALIEEDMVPVLFWEGDCTSRLEIICDIPAGKAVYWFERTDIFKAKEILGDRVCLQGNVPISIMSAGTPDDVKEYCKKLIDGVGKNGGYIMNCGTIVEDAKPENIHAMIDFTKEYGMYR